MQVFEYVKESWLIAKPVFGLGITSQLLKRKHYYEKPVV
jgi:hypothetical protein